MNGFTFHKTNKERTMKPLKYGDKVFGSRKEFAKHIGKNQNGISRIIKMGEYNGIKIEPFVKKESLE